MAVESSASGSAAAATVTGCGSCQLVGAKVNVSPEAMVVSGGPASEAVTMTAPAGAEASRTESAALAPSSTRNGLRSTISPGGGAAEGP